MLTFDEVKHEYRLQGFVIPSVTQIIRSLLPGWQADDYYLQRGRAMHYGIALYNRGDLDWSTVAPEIKPRIEAWAEFRKQINVRAEAIELSMAHATFRYAGTTDFIGDDNKTWLITDAKSSLEPQSIPQIGGYSLMWRLAAPTLKPHRGCVAELREDGTFRTKWLSIEEVKLAEQTFLGMLTTYNFAREHNLLKGAA